MPNDEIKTKKKNVKLADIYRKYGTIIIFVGIFIIASVVSPYFLTAPNLINVVRQIVVVTLLALGVVFVIILGQIDVSLGSVVALTGCIACSVMSSTQNLILTIFAGLIIGVIVGITNGFLVTQYQIPAFIATLAMNTVARGAVLLYTNGNPITNLGNFSIIGQGSIGFIPISALILLVFIGISWTILNKTKFGRHVYAVGGNAKAAEAAGIDVKKVVRRAFIYNGILTAMAGIVLMSRINSGQPAAGVSYEFDAITAVVVGGTSLSGGTGSIGGTVIGAAIIGIINNILNLLNVHSYWQQVAKGIIIAIAVILDVRTKREER